MDLSPSASPDCFIDNIRCNLDSKYVNCRDSVNTEVMCIYARIRPMLEHEIGRGYKECIAAIDDNTVRVVVPANSAKYKNSRQNQEIIEDYTFTSAFGPESGQFVFFQETMTNTMQNFIEGVNNLVFSYGITGSGKTYTLQGNSENPGLIPLSLKLYFSSVEKQLLTDIIVKPHQYDGMLVLSENDRRKESYQKHQLLSLYDTECENAPGSFRISNSKSFAMSLCEFFYDGYEAEQRESTLPPEEMAAAQAAQYLKDISKKSASDQLGVVSVWVSFIEIYNENIFDLLQPVTNDRARLSLGEDKNGNVYVKGTKEICVSNSEEALKLLNIGRRNLSIASTKMNYQSSRSHCIYSLRVVRVLDKNNLSHGKVTRLCFCDLAGSERVAKTQTVGMRLKEAGCINTSLLVLGRCFEQLRMNQSGREKRMIPFRESKLTRLLSGFFLGNGKAVMVTNASPSDYTFDETLHVLKFSALARKIAVNDNSISSTSVALQSVCEEWKQYKANNSNICNESMESITSDSEILQVKDDLIEKLLELAEEQKNEIIKLRNEKAGLEIKIQDVCRDYAEYSDGLLETKSMLYQEEIEAIKQAHKKRIAAMEKMYEDIIKGYKDQLESETDESFSEKSSADLDESGNKSRRWSSSFLTNSELDKPADRPISNSEETEQLNSKICSLTSELDKIKEELQNNQNATSNLEIELCICKTEKEELQKQCNELQKSSSKYLESVTENERTIKELEEQLMSLRGQLSTSNSKVELKAFNVAELESEIEVCKNETAMLKKELEAVNKTKVSYEDEIKALKATKSGLEIKVLDLQKDNNAAHEEIQQKSDTLSALEKDIMAFKSEIKALGDSQEKSIASKDENEKYIKQLEDELSSAKSDMNAAKNDLDAKSENIKNLQSEIEVYKEKINEVKCSSESLADVHTRHEQEIVDLKEKIKHLEDKLHSFTKEAKCQKIEQSEKDDYIAQLQADIDSYILKNKNIQDQQEKSDAEKCEMKTELSNYCNKIAEMDKMLSLRNEELKTCRDEIEDKSSKLQKLENRIDECNLEIKELKDEKETVDAEKQELETELSNHNSKIAELVKKISLKNDELKACREEIEQKSSKLEELESSIDSQSEEMGKLSKDKQQLHAELSKLKTEITKHQNKIGELETQVTSTTDDLHAANRKVEEKSLQLTELQHNIKKYLSEIENLKSQKKLDAEHFDMQLREAQCQNNSKELDEILNQKNEELKAAKIEIQEKSSKLTEFESSINSYCIEIENLKRDQKETELENVNSRNEISVLKNKINDLQIKLSTMSEELNAGKAENDQKSLQVSELTNDILLHKNKTDELQKMLSMTADELNENKIEIKQKSHHVSELESEISDHKNKIKELGKNLSSVNDELNAAKAEIKRLSEKITDDSAYAMEIKNLKVCQEELNNEKAILIKEINSYKYDIVDLQEKLAGSNKEIEARKTEIEVKSMRISELELEIESGKLDYDKALMENQQRYEEEKSDLMTLVSRNEEKICELEKELAAANTELENSRAKIHQRLSSTPESKKMASYLKEIEDLVKEKAKSNVEISELQDKIAQLEEGNKELNTKLTLTTAELSSATKEIQEKYLKLEEIKKENLIYKSEVDNYVRLSQLSANHDNEENVQALKEELSFIKEKLQIQTLSCQEMEAEVLQLKKSIEEKNIELEEALKKHKETSEKHDLLETKHGNFYEEFNALQNEKNALEETLASVSEQLSSAEKSFEGKLLESENAALRYKKEVDSLNKQISDLLLNIDVLEEKISSNETALHEMEEKLKEVQDSCDRKLASEKEQHEIEIQQILQVKQGIEEENELLNNEISKFKETTQKSDETSSSSGGKENILKTQKSSGSIAENRKNSRALSQRQMKTKVPVKDDNSENSPSDEEIEVPKQRTRKRVSDSDFEPPKDKAPKRMQKETASKMVKRPSRRKLDSQTEALSPVQKIANSIGAKFRSVAESVSSVASPRLTRGRKKLFNPEASTSIKNEKVTRTRKAAGRS